MKHKLKRLVSIALACVMVLALLPASALAVADKDRDGSSFIFTRTGTNGTEYVQTAVKGGSTYILQEQQKSSAAPAAYTFYLEKTSGTVSHDETDYFVYRVYVQPASGTKLYLTVTGGTFGLSSDQTKAFPFVIYETTQVLGFGQSRSVTLLCSGSTTIQKGHAVEFTEGGYSRTLEWCKQAWHACGNAYDLVTEGNLTSTTYTVTYNANADGATGSVTDSNSPYSEGAAVTVLANGFAREHYTFTEWNTNADGSGTSYKAGDTFTISANTTLYAQWEVDDWDDENNSTTGGDDIPDKYQALVTYKVEGGTWDGKDAGDKIEVFTLKTKNATTGEWEDINPAPTLDGTIPDTTNAKPDDTHTTPAYWSPTPRATDKVKAGTTVYTYKFSPKGDALTFTFDANGGAWTEAVAGYDMNGEKTTASTTLFFGDEVTKIPVEPVLEGYDFAGWYSKNNKGELTAKWWPFDDSKEYVYADQTVYAKWVESEVEPPVPEKTATLIINIQDENGAALADLVEVEVTGSYLISQTDTDADYVIPNSITAYDGGNYIYECVASGALSGTVKADKGTIIVCLQYTKDNWDADGDKTTGGDGIPDKYQVVIEYVSADSTMGSVDPELEVVTLPENEDGSYKASAEITAEGSTATPTTATAQIAYRFANWTDEAGEEVSTDATFAPSFTAEGGETYTFTANFNVPAQPVVPGENASYLIESYTEHEDGTYTKADTVVGGPAKIGTQVTASASDKEKVIPGYAFDPNAAANILEATVIMPYTDDEGAAHVTTLKLHYAKDVIGGTDPENPGDNIPDKYQVVIEYTSNTKQGTTNPAKEVVTIYDDNGNYAETGTVTARSTAKANSGYEFAKWNDEDGKAVSTRAKLEQTIENAKGGETYLFVAKFTAEYSPSVPEKPEPPVLNTEDHVAYIIGFEDGTVRPLDTISRAEVATIFFRLLTDESRDKYWSVTNRFEDVDSTAWYNNAVSTLDAAGIIIDSENGKFRPNDPITRAELAVMAAQFTGLVTDKSSSFSDVPDSHWAAMEIAVVEQQGWITGYEDGTYRPDNSITRAETMAIINRMLERAVDEDHMLRSMVTWSDNLPGTWYYEIVQEATNSHTYTRTDDKVPNEDYCYEDWQELLDNPDWAALEKTWSTANSANA